MDFSVQANAALDWVFSVMKPSDHLLILNVLNLKAPSIIILRSVIRSIRP